MICRIKSYIRLGSKKRQLLQEAALSLLAVRILLLFLPVRYALRISTSGTKNNSEQLIAELQNVKWAILKADRVVFWKSNCLIKSISGRWMLQRRGIESKISFGIRKSNHEKVTAHAWLKVNDVEIVERGENYIELETF